MFTPKTEKIAVLSKEFSDVIGEMDNLFAGKTRVYIDFANVIPWQPRFGWHIDVKRLKQLLDSYNQMECVSLYHGTKEYDMFSANIIEQARQNGYRVVTKPVKEIRISMDVSGVDDNSPAILRNFIRKPFLDKMDIESIVFLNHKIQEMNRGGIRSFVDLKCNFDVEIGVDMLLDKERNTVETFVLWSGDSDFTDIVNQLRFDGKNVIIFASAGKVSRELSETGAPIFEIKKIREFICWVRELGSIKAKRTPEEALKL